MPRIIPIALQQHIAGGATTLCTLVRIEPVAPGYPVIGVTTLDRDVVYDDGAGPVTYYAQLGADLSATLATNDMAVDNTEATSLVPAFDVPVSEADLVAGVYDYARWTGCLVNYQALDQGHVILGTGELGQVKVVDGLSFLFETLGLTKRLKQTIVEKDSLRCRATFGSQPEGTEGAVVTQRFPCGFDTSGMWVPGEVSSVGEESNRTFAAAALAGAFAPGVLKWVTGANAGRTYEVEECDAGVVSLLFTTMFPIAAGDTFEIRPDCTKWKDDALGCKSHWGAEWVLHYRGEPYIPVGDTGQLNTPGGSGATGSSGSSGGGGVDPEPEVCPVPSIVNTPTVTIDGSNVLHITFPLQDMLQVSDLFPGSSYGEIAINSLSPDGFVRRYTQTQLELTTFPGAVVSGATYTWDLYPRNYCADGEGGGGYANGVPVTGSWTAP